MRGGPPSSTPQNDEPDATGQEGQVEDPTKLESSGEEESTS
jgi:hypothetical protein